MLHSMQLSAIIFIVLLIAISVISTPNAAEVIQLPSEYQESFQDSSAFHDISMVKNLPPSILDLCVYKDKKMANPDEPWEASDVITDENLPRRRLIWAVVKGDLYVVHYETGGYAHSFYFLVAEAGEDGASKAIWRGSTVNQVNNFQDFVSALQSNHIQNRNLDGYH